MVLSVKGGAIDPADIRDLRGVLERECGASGASAGAGVEMAGFISLEPPASAVAKEADHAGLYEYRGERYPRIQLLTIQDIFDGKRWHCPSIVKTTQKDSGQPCLSL
jgi:hypothetical protein